MNSPRETLTDGSSSTPWRVRSAHPKAGGKGRATGKDRWRWWPIWSWNLLALLVGVAAGIHLNRYDYPDMPIEFARDFAWRAVKRLAQFSCFYPDPAQRMTAHQDRRSDHWVFTYRIAAGTPKEAELWVVIDRHGDLESYYTFGAFPSCQADGLPRKPALAHWDGVRWPGGWW